MANAQNWTCPFCNRPQVMTDGQSDYFIRKWELASYRYEKDVGLEGWAIACSNPECGEINIGVNFLSGKHTDTHDGWRFVKRTEHEKYVLRPSHHSKPQPAFIPKALRDDYLEACKIRNLSPKASATLARRCLQGMIHDFCGISKGRLFDEITALKALVDEEKAPKGVSSESVDAIDHVRLCNGYRILRKYLRFDFRNADSSVVKTI